MLAAVANGNTTRGAIASYAGRKATDLGHYLNVWEDTGLLTREVDAFRPGRSWFRLTEPLLTFYEVVCRPRWGQLEAGRAETVWADAKARFNAQVVGPHFEALCRRWAALAGPDVFGALPGSVGAGVIADPQQRTKLEIDVAVFAPTDGGQPRRLLSIGEVKWGRTMTLADVGRLRRAATVLDRQGWDTGQLRFACYSAAGFDDALQSAARTDPQVQLVSLVDLYSHA